MPAQDPPYYFEPPHQAQDGRLSWNPDGPDGRLIDLTVGEHGTPIGELVRSGEPPAHGWIRGPEGTAIPETMISYGPPPGVLVGGMPDVSSQAGSVGGAVLLLLLS